MTEHPSCVELVIGSPVTKSAVWLHGMGANRDGFESTVPYLGLPREGITIGTH